MATASTTSKAFSPGPIHLFGRSGEQRLLRAMLQDAAHGGGGLVVIGGEAGIGKTALARDLAAVATANNVLTLSGHCYDYTNTPPYGLWLDLTNNYRPAGDMPSLPTALATGRIDEIESQSALFSEARSFFAALSATCPVLLVLEDCHWADPASLELLRHLGAGSGGHALMLLVTYRSDELTRQHAFYQQLPSLIRETDGRRVELRRLTVADLRALISGLYPMAIAEEERLTAYLDRHADGNPFFVMELLHALAEERLLERAGDVWTLQEPDQIVMPALVRQVIDGRVDRLGEETRQLLAMAAVIGQDVPLALWALLAGVDESDLLSTVETAIAAHLLDAVPDGTRVRFVHALTRETLYGSIVPPRRRQWHRTVGDTLATDELVSPDVVAYHLQQGGDPRAWEWHERAGVRAQRAYAWLTAIERFSTAADLLDGVPGMEARRGRLLYRCGRLRRYSDSGDGIAYLEAAERQADHAGIQLLAADAKYSRGLLRCFADDFGVGLVEMEAGIHDLEALPDSDAQPSWGHNAWMADALPARELVDAPDFEPAAGVLIGAGIHHRRGSLPWFLAAAGHLKRALPMAEQFIALADGIPAGGLVISATGHSWFGLGLIRAALGQPIEARHAFARARAIYHLLDHHAVIGFSLLSELRDVVLTYYTTEVAERRLLAAEAEAALGRAAGAFPSDRSPRRARLGLLYLDGKWDEACAIAEEVEIDGNYVLRREVTNVLAPIWYHRGQADLVREHIRTLLPQGPAAEPGGIVHLDGLLLQRLAARLALDRGVPSEAHSWLEANDRWLAWSGAVLGRAENQLCWARYCQQAGDSGGAVHRADAAIAAASSPRQPLALLQAHRTRGELATAAGDYEIAANHLEQALQLAEACAAPFERGLSLIARAELRLALEQRREAGSDLEDARRIVGPLRAQPMLTKIDELSARLREVEVVIPAGLTSRELEVLRLVAEGMTDADVAERLFISPRTVSQHLRSVYGKLGVSSRSAATRFAVEHNLT